MTGQLRRGSWTIVLIYALVAIAALVLGLSTAAVGIGAAAIVTAVLFWATGRRP